jgi:hypothetical protein
MNLFEKLTKQSEDKGIEELKQYLKVILTLTKVESNLYSLTAKRSDNIDHTVLFSPWLFPTAALLRARKRLIHEIEIVSGKQVYVVNDFNTAEL